MRAVYQENLEDLITQLSDTLGDVSSSMETATRALLQADIGDAESVLGSVDAIENKLQQCDDSAFALLALQAPVASDLRQVVSSIRLVNDIRRMSVLSIHVASVARRHHPEKALPEPVNGYFAEMGRVAVALARGAREVLQSRSAQEATDLIKQDAAMNDLRQHLNKLLSSEWEHGVQAAVDVTLLGRYYERYADHACEVARRVVYLVTGELPAAGDVGDEELTGYDLDIAR